MRSYVKEFEKLGFGMFVHFGLYSMVGRGEWIRNSLSAEEKVKYDEQISKFKVKKGWARELARTARDAGCKYITLTTRHHDGFSLYDTCGLNEFDAPHSATGRDLVAEFVEACREYGLVPFFYHTLLDWHVPSYNEDFPAYIDYLVASVELLCRNYGPIGGLWFDGMWNKPEADWQEDRLYGMIRKYQPRAMIINNTGLSARGHIGHPELDSVTFERGESSAVDTQDRPRAGEMCEVLNDHWGYASEDFDYKPLPKLLQSLFNCRGNNCNFLLNVGPMPNGGLRPIDKAMMQEIGRWLKPLDGLIYRARRSPISVNDAVTLTDGDYHYVVIPNVPVNGNADVVLVNGEPRTVTIEADAPIQDACWLEDSSPIEVTNNTFCVKPFPYGISRYFRIARFRI